MTRNTARRYYEIRESLPEPTCPLIDTIKARVSKTDKTTHALLEQLRAQHVALRMAAKASALLALELDPQETP